MKIKFFVDKKSFCSRAAVTALLISVFFRLVGSIGSWSDAVYFRFGFLMPVCACALVCLSILLLGKKALWTSSLGVAAGGAFFIFRIIKSMEDSFSIHSNAFFADNPKLWLAVFIAAYVVITVIFILTVFTLIKNKWTSVVLFAIPLLGHLYYDYITLVRNEQITPLGLMNEMSVLAMLTGMFFLSLGLKKAYKVLSGNTVAPPVPGNSLSGAKPAVTQEKTPENTEAGSQPAAAEAEVKEPEKEAEVPEISVMPEVQAEEPAPVLSEPEKSADEESQAAPVSLEELLDNLPESSPLTLDPIVPERHEPVSEESAAEEVLQGENDVPQGTDEPERLDAIVPQKKLSKLFRK